MGEEKIDENIWKAVQDRVGYTDEQLALYKKRPFAQKILKTSVIQNVLRTNVVFEVVESDGCNIRHLVGDEFHFNGEGYMITRKCPEKVCPYILPFMTRMMWLVQERIYEGLDPRPTFPFGGCDDVGLECGGMGRVLLETKIRYDGD